jgi:hypothetical protein
VCLRSAESAFNLFNSQLKSSILLGFFLQLGVLTLQNLQGFIVLGLHSGDFSLFFGYMPLKVCFVSQGSLQVDLEILQLLELPLGLGLMLL